MARRYYRVAGSPLAIVAGPSGLSAMSNISGMQNTSGNDGWTDDAKRAFGLRWADEPAIESHENRTFVSAVYNAGTDEVDETWTIATKPVGDLRAAKKAAAAVVFAAKIAAGRNNADGNNYQLGTDKTGTPSMLNFTAMATKAEASIRDGTANPWPEGFTFRTTANVNVAKTAQQMFDLASDVGEYVRALRVRLWAINDTVNAASNKAAVDAVDVNAGWPSNV